MAHITLSIPDEIHREMKKHPEIKWSEIARQNIIEKAMALKKSMHIKDLLKLLPIETQKSIESADIKQSKKFFRDVKKKEWERTKYLTQA